MLKLAKLYTIFYSWILPIMGICFFYTKINIGLYIVGILLLLISIDAVLILKIQKNFFCESIGISVGWIVCQNFFIGACIGLCFSYLILSIIGLIIYKRFTLY